MAIKYKDHMEKVEAETINTHQVVDLGNSETKKYPSDHVPVWFSF